MSNPVEAISSRMARRSSRRGFLATLGKAALFGGAILAGLGVTKAYAACGDCPSPCCPTESCNQVSENDTYVGCCDGPSGWFETRACVNKVGGYVDCYYVFQSTANCPHTPQVAP
jgi:hypothetical protein